jgi:hypothetical protein
MPAAPMPESPAMSARLLPIVLYSSTVLVAATAQAQTPLDPSVHALCEAHTDALFGALDEARYDAATADFDAALRARDSAAKLRRDYESLPSKFGKPLGRGRPHVGDMAGHAVVMVPLIFERGTLTAEVHCGGDGSITDFRLLPTQVMAPSG